MSAKESGTLKKARAKKNKARKKAASAPEDPNVLLAKLATEAEALRAKVLADLPSRSTVLSISRFNQTMQEFYVSQSQTNWHTKLTHNDATVVGR
jgi:putative heme iron utilization protein